MQSTVSVRGQTVVPRPIRETLGITTSTKLEWQVRDGVILVFVIPKTQYEQLSVSSRIESRPQMSF